VLRGNFHGASETVKRPVRVAACDGCGFRRSRPGITG
jgi:hypothetical protein